MTNANDWHTLPAGLALDRIVAERLGWTEISDEDVFEEDAYTAGFRQRLRGVNPYNEDGCTIPEYSTDANAALALLDDLTADGVDFDLDVSRVDDMNFRDKKWRDLAGKLYYCASFYRGKNDDRETVAYSEADAPALAVCRAWLTWKEKQS